MNRLKLSDIVKHNKQYINFNGERSKQDTINFYAEHYTDEWTRTSTCIDIDVNKEQIKTLLA